MMTGEVRRAPRAAHENGTPVRLARRVAVRVVNISMTGVLLEASDGAADVRHGDELELTVPLGEAGFTATLQVGREDPLPDARTGARRRVGCAFVNMDPGRRQQLAQFLAGALLPSRAEQSE